MRDEEHKIQCAVVRWFNYQYPKLIMYAIPNGGQRNAIVATKLKAEGVRAGVFDLFLMTARGGFHGMFIEMKSAKGRMSEKQKLFKYVAESENYHVAECNSLDSAIKAITEYLGMGIS